MGRSRRISRLVLRAKAVHTRNSLAESPIRLNRAGKLGNDFAYQPGTIAYHLPCHIKYQFAVELSAATREALADDLGV